MKPTTDEGYDTFRPLVSRETDAGDRKEWDHENGQTKDHQLSEAHSSMIIDDAKFGQKKNKLKDDYGDAANKKQKLASEGRT